MFTFIFVSTFMLLSSITLFYCLQSKKTRNVKIKNNSVCKKIRKKDRINKRKH